MGRGRGRVLAVAVAAGAARSERGSIGPIRERPGQVSAVKGLGPAAQRRGRDARTPAPACRRPARRLSAADTDARARAPAGAASPCRTTRRTSRCARSRCRRRARARRSRSRSRRPRPRPARSPSRPGRSAILRRAPEGEVPLAPHLSVTFSQPMVAVTSHDDLAKAGVPVRLRSAAARGSGAGWARRTLLFEPDVRFPMATEYRVEVPAGHALGDGRRAAPRPCAGRSARPPPVLETKHPADVPARRQPVLFASFDQAIDPAAVLRDDPRAPRRASPLRLATPDEVKADEDVSRLAAQAAEGRWLAFVPESPLPPDAASRSRSGPARRRRRARARPRRRRSGASARSARCGSSSTAAAGTASARPARPGRSSSRTRSTRRRCEARPRPRRAPSCPALQVERRPDDWLNVRGRTKGRTTYRVTLSPDIRDAFGQTLGRAGAADVHGRRRGADALRAAAGFVVLDPAAGPRFSVYSVNHDALKVRAHAVAPADWPAFAAFMQNLWRDRSAPPPGRPVAERDREGRRARGRADGDAHRPLGRAHERPGPRGAAGRAGQGSVQSPRRPPPVVAWVQATQIGLDAFADGERLRGLGHGAADGRPLERRGAPAPAAGLTARDRARTAWPPSSSTDSGGSVLVARRGDDVALLPENARLVGRRRAAGSATRPRARVALVRLRRPRTCTGRARR